MSCDLCDKVLVNDFIYYCATCTGVQILDGIISQTGSKSSFDMCSECFDKIISIMTKNNGKFCCDATGIQFNKSACSYNTCKIEKCVVNLTDQQYICTKCSLPKLISEVPCNGCDKSTKLIKTAEVIVTHVVDLNINDDFISKIENRSTYNV